MNPDFLDVEDVVEIHDVMLEKYGGSGGIRDTGLLESAVAAPQASFDGEFLHEDLFEMAAAYLFHIVKNHPFVDGNKRVGLQSALGFLEINGHVIEEGTQTLEDLTWAVAEGQCDKARAAHLLRLLATE